MVTKCLNSISTFFNERLRLDTWWMSFCSSQYKLLSVNISCKGVLQWRLCLKFGLLRYWTHDLNQEHSFKKYSMDDLRDLLRWKYHLVVLSRILIALIGNMLLEKNNPPFLALRIDVLEVLLSKNVVDHWNVSCGRTGINYNSDDWSRSFGLFQWLWSCS